MRYLVGLGAASARALIRTLDNAIMPRNCVFCGTECEVGEACCCRGCAEDLPWNEPQCARCALSLPVPLPAGVNCADCQRHPPPYVAAATPLTYTFPVDAAIKALKFRRRLDYGPVFGAMLVAMLTKLPDDIDAVLPVPLHWRRQALRGFNQAAELCRPLQKSTGLPLVPNVSRVRATSYQSGLAAPQRRRNLRAAFVVTGAVAARHVLIVDDVITSGATCRQLAWALLRAGAEKVSVVAVARALRPATSPARAPV